jgi:AraC-like DNA-binding protein
MHSASLDQTAAAGAGGIVASKFAAIAHDWGYSCDVSCDRAPPSSSDRRDAFLARGFLRSFHLPSGLRLCATDQTVVANNRRSGVLGRSLTVMFALEGDPLHYEVEGYGPLTIARGQALAVSSPDSLCLSSRLTTGQRTRSLVLQAQVEHMCDAELAEAVERHLSRTAFQWLPDEAGAGFLARALFPSVPPGVVGRLRAESCALELLALALGGTQDEPEYGAANTRDKARILAIRDLLMTHLDADHHLSGLAREAGMSPTAFKIKFAAVVGQPVFRFLREQRLLRARDGLRHEGWTVSQAAFYVGYRHPANFATAFRRRFGVAPTADQQLTRRGLPPTTRSSRD